MDLNDYWQENKRFIVTVVSGLLIFLIGSMIVGNVYGGEVTSMRRALLANTSRLKSERYSTADRDAALAENEALKSALGELRQRVDFEPRPEFAIDPSQGSASNQYFGAVDRVTSELLRLASRKRLVLPQDLGLEMLMTTREEIIVRHMEALDLIDRTIRCALDTGVRRIDSIQVKLDPGLGSRGGPGAVEQTTIRFKMTSKADSIVRMLAQTQSDRFGQSLVLTDLKLSGASSKQDEVRLDVTFAVVHLHGLEDEEVEG